MHTSVEQKLSFWQQVGLILALSTGLLLGQPVAADHGAINDFSEQLNTIRRNHNLPLLKVNVALNNVAQEHADDMYERGYFSHSNLSGQNSIDRLRAKNISFQRAAENIAKGQKTNRSVLTAWMNSPGHRKNILNPKYLKFGIGMTNYNWVLDFTN